MEFERQNIVITEWEAEKAKNAGDRKEGYNIVVRQRYRYLVEAF